jgi:hypothetical protein
MTMDEATPRELAGYLVGLPYPASRDDVIRTAASNGADDDVLDRLRNMEDGDYESMDAVSAGFTVEGDTTTRYGHVTIYDQ